jgi:cysteinyl-tRNA synthetase
MTISLHNSLSRKLEVFKPIDAKNIRMYVCGPTVYDYAHIGNARPPVVFDILYRLLRREFGAEHVTYARNFTDIDDKIMARAEKDGVAIGEITERFTKIYQEDMDSLNNLSPDLEPKATEHLPEMIAMMESLLAKGFAYEKEGHVLFHTPAMVDYGKLSGHNREELEVGARVEIAPYKKDATDFVMWKPSSEQQVGWDSPWGRGRPGWHLECSAMIEKHLGQTIDIHGGGQDLIFPHHENEIAQSQCCHDKPFVNYWLHNGYLNMKGEKMSKSVGNIRTIRSLLGDFPGEALRLSLLSAYYRGPLDFNSDMIAEQKRRLDRWYRIVDGVEVGELPQSVLAALEDDLNTPKALAELEKLANPDAAAQLKAGAQFMGLLMEDTQTWLKGSGDGGLSDAEIDALIVERNTAKADKNYARSDEIRDQLKADSIILEDSAQGTTWRRD